MSKQLYLAAAAAVFAMSALALLSPDSAHPSDALGRLGGSGLAAPSVELPSVFRD